MLLEVEVMLIRVKYIDDRFDMVRPRVLNSLIEAGKVLEFERMDGWVMPGIDTMRSRRNRNDYTGPERRLIMG